MDDDLLPPVSGDTPEVGSNLPPALNVLGDGLPGAGSPLTLPAASLPTGEIAPAEAAAASSAAPHTTPAHTPVEQAARTPSVPGQPAALLAKPAETPLLPAPTESATDDAAVDDVVMNTSLPARAARWLPTTRQLANGARLRVNKALGPNYATHEFTHGVHTSMRQALGLVVAVGLISGLSHMIWLWATLARAGTVIPLQRLESWSALMALRLPTLDSFALINQQVSGLAPRAPAWIAAGLNAFGAWLTLPMRLLTIWIIYGLLMLAVAKVLGAGTTLPRFYAALGYAALPGLLLMLWPLPWVGLIAALLAAILALIAAFRAVRAATELDGARSLIVLLLPAVVLLAVWGLFGAIAVAITLV